MIKDIKRHEWVTEVVESELPVVVLFYSMTCSSCHKMMGTLETMDKVYNKRYKIVKIETREGGQFMLPFGTSGTPLVAVMNKGYLVQSNNVLNRYGDSPNKALWLGSADYIQYFIQFLDAVLHAINTGNSKHS